MHALHDHPDIDLRVIVAGMHLEARFGRTVEEVEADGFTIAGRLRTLAPGDQPADIAASIAKGIEAFARHMASNPPDMLVIIGDRFDMYSAAVSALPLAIPIAHIHGGELTLGAFDDALRHSMTKLSHLHFATTQDYAHRIRQLGEEDWRIVVSGAPSLDNLNNFRPLSRETLEGLIGASLGPAPLLVTFHPTTLEYQDVGAQTESLLAALQIIDREIVITLPNADTGNETIINKLHAFCQNRENAHVVNNLGTKAYFSLMKLAGTMIGNSSSGLIEAPSFGLPVVNIGTRQHGRIRAANVIDVDYDTEEITAGLQRALDPAFKASLDGLMNPYGNGTAAAKIVEKIVSVPLGRSLVFKQFQDRSFNE
jgi:UDP-hydrolysing UDP-N-acetyl-D-glucosamine 2-epimerase